MKDESQHNYDKYIIHDLAFVLIQNNYEVYVKIICDFIANCLLLQTVMVKKNLIITARVIGRPEPEVKWFKYVQNKYIELSLVVCLQYAMRIIFLIYMLIIFVNIVNI